MSARFIANRELLFSEKGKPARASLRVSVSEPTIVDRTASGVKLDAQAAVCTISFEGLGIADVEVHGADSLHALAQASDVDRYLRGMSKKFDFFWPNGDPYFDE
jgi:hypothetical protein